MCDFRDAKVGDRVWSMEYGWANIYAILGSPSQNPIVVQWGSDNRAYYTYEGKRYARDINPTLFWDEVRITPPSRPKRKVKKVIEGWINIYDPLKTKGFSGNCGSPIATTDSTYQLGQIWASKEEANARAAHEISPITGPVHIRHEYEVEE